MTITVKSLHSDSGHPYGPKYAIRISKDAAIYVAQTLSVHVPRMGSEVLIAQRSAGQGFKNALYLQNRSGWYFIASCNLPVDKWIVFDVEVK